MKPAADNAAGFTFRGASATRKNEYAVAHERLTVPRRAKSRAHDLPFVTTTYEADPDGMLRAQLPSRCVFATGAQTCSIFLDHYRLRKTGPGHPVAVIGCGVHPYGRYTLYPPGHVPYGRQPVAAYYPSGQLVLDTESGGPRWERTVFAAALDAAKGESWPAEGRWFEEADPRRRQTQARGLQLAGRLVGVHPELEDTVRERVATRLAVPTMTLIGGAGSWAKSWKLRGEAILEVLEAIPKEASLLDRLLSAGAASGLWGQPRRWEARRGCWVGNRWLGSRGSEQRGAGRSHSRGPPSTKVTHPAGP